MAHANHQERNKGHHHQNHFLVVVYGIQGHLNPARLLARRLARADGSTLATLSVPLSGHRRMFPSLASPDEEVFDGVVSYVPFSDGFDEGSWPKDAEDRAHSRSASFKSLSAVLGRLAASGQPVTCIVSTLGMSSVPEVAREHGIPLAFYWIQPATALAAYYHYFHGYDELLASHASDPAYEVSLPGLHPLRIRDFPSFLVETTNNDMSQMVIQMFREVFEHLDGKVAVGGGEKPKILVNTFHALETTAIRAMQPQLEVFAVGPMVPPLDVRGEEITEARIHLFRKDDKGYMEWLGARPEKSVVYVSFGSLLTYNKRQVEEIVRGLQECGRPYLWVVRKEGREDEVERCLMDNHREQDQGMVVEWCEQLEVLVHPSVGCFVTHCGWNSTLEAVVCGVPMVAVPQWSDQPLNAHLVEEDWGVGVRAERGKEGILVGAELTRCVELVMGDCKKAAEIREKANVLKERAREATAGGGPAERSLRHFVKAMQTSKKVHQEDSQPTNADTSELAE